MGKVDYSTDTVKLQQELFSRVSMAMEEARSISKKTGLLKEYTLLSEKWSNLAKHMDLQENDEVLMQKFHSVMDNFSSLMERVQYARALRIKGYSFTPEHSNYRPMRNRSLLNLSSNRSRSRRSPVRSAAKAGDDGGEDSDGSDSDLPPWRWLLSNTHRLTLLMGGVAR